MTLTLNLPSTSLASTRPISQVQVSPMPLAAILDHHLRRPDTQDRVFGTLLGVRSDLDNSVRVRNAFGVPYEAHGKGQVTIDMDHHRALLDLHLKVNPREVVVGWYATSPALNSFTALIHSFYTSESAPFPAVHLTLDPSSLAFTTYISSPIGTSLRNDHLTFVPVESSLQVAEQERPGLDLLAQNLTSLERSTASAPPQINSDVNVVSPLATLHSLVEKVSIMLDQVLEYVRQVAAGEREGDEKIGRALLETVGHVPASVGAKSMSGSKKSRDKAKDFEEEFNAHLADVLMVSYLANLVKTQTEISSRLNLLV
ncbi:eukaryotic translation initiation factor 3 subunit F [Sporobolomyces salmoneus]|uniref:eukaryotic translation initiation factor 3 subunit F n=1 Tax=Sporobolomyces salmoneus TaxID=183962 RepID=UPI00317FB888